MIELPGVKDIERAKELIGQTAKLEFKVVDDKSKSLGELQALVSDAEAKNKDKFPEGMKLSARIRTMNELLKGKIPATTELAYERVKNSFGKITNDLVPYLLQQKAAVTGEDLKDAFVSTDQQSNLPEVSLSFNFAGT